MWWWASKSCWQTEQPMVTVQQLPYCSFAWWNLYIFIQLLIANKAFHFNLPNELARATNRPCNVIPFEMHCGEFLANWSRPLTSKCSTLASHCTSDLHFPKFRSSKETVARSHTHSSQALNVSSSIKGRSLLLGVNYKNSVVLQTSCHPLCLFCRYTHRRSRKGVAITEFAACD